MPRSSPVVENVDPADLIGLGYRQTTEGLSDAQSKLMDKIFGEAGHIRYQGHALETPNLEVPGGSPKIFARNPLALGAAKGDSMSMSEVDAKIAAAEARTETKFAEMRGHVDKSNAEVRGEISTMRTEISGKIDLINANFGATNEKINTLHTDVERVSAEVKEAKNSTSMWAMWVIAFVVGTGVALGSLGAAVWYGNKAEFASGLNAAATADNASKNAVMAVTSDIKTLNTKYDTLNTKIDGLIKAINVNQKAQEPPPP